MKFNTAVDSGSDAHFLIMTKKQQPAELRFKWRILSQTSTGESGKNK